MTGTGLESPSLRIFLTGRLCVEGPRAFVDPLAFPGRQGRVAFGYLVTERGRPVARDELIEVLWPGESPPSCDIALSALVSKLRSMLRRLGLPPGVTLTSAVGCYELRLPADVWVDLEAAADAIHEAEGALRNGDPRAAYGPSAVAHHIARRPFLAGESGTWIDARRARLQAILIRALECRAEVYLWNRENALALEAAREILGREPFRETGHQLLIRAHAATGNTAEALRAYEGCRRLIAEELGVDPSRETKAVYERVLATLQ